VLQQKWISFLIWQSEAWQEIESREGGCIETNVLGKRTVRV